MSIESGELGKGWGKDLPSQIVSKLSKDDIKELERRINLLSDRLKEYHLDVIREEEKTDEIIKRLERLEISLITGTNAISTRVALLEMVDKHTQDNLAKIVKELELVQSQITPLVSFPFGIKGIITGMLIISVLTNIITVIMIETNNFPKQVIEYFKGD